MKSLFSEHYQVFTSATLKDGLRNLKSDLLIIDLRLPRILKGRWLENLSKDKDLLNGEIAIVLIASANLKDSEQLFQLTRFKAVQDIFWMNEDAGFTIADKAFTFFLAQNFNQLHFKRANCILTHENLSFYYSGRAKSLSQLYNNQQEHFCSFLFGSSQAVNRFRIRLAEATRSNRIAILMAEEGLEQEQISYFIFSSQKLKKEHFISVDFNKLPTHVQAAMLFGYKSGTIPSSLRPGKGALERAQGGLLYLANIDSLSWQLQSKLLQALQEGQYSRYGERKKIKIECKIVLSNNKLLEKKVEQGKFRQDLFFRINAFPIEVPCLKERKSDIPAIIDGYCQHLEKESTAPLYFETDAKLYLAAKEWSGNIKQLIGKISEYCTLSSKFPITLRSLKMIENSIQQQEKKEKSITKVYGSKEDSSEQLHIFTALSESIDYTPPLKAVEKEYIQKILKQNEYNYSQSARILGISRKALYDKVKRFGKQTHRAM